jgi:GNAT superfamily N-acetyltransferase
VLGERDAGDYVVRSLDKALASVVGRASEASLRETVARGGPLEILCAENAVQRTLTALPAWGAEPATIHLLGPTAPPPPPPRADLRVVPPDEPLALGYVLPPLRQELEAARLRSPLAVAFVAGLAASFAYAPWQTETLFDVSIDTVEAHRGRGLGAASVALLIEHMRSTGKQPVWGALDGNTASLRLARRLGFVPVDRLFVVNRLAAAREAV